MTPTMRCDDNCFSLAYFTCLLFIGNRNSNLIAERGHHRCTDWGARVRFVIFTIPKMKITFSSNKIYSGEKGGFYNNMWQSIANPFLAKIARWAVGKTLEKIVKLRGRHATNRICKLGKARQLRQSRVSWAVCARREKETGTGPAADVSIKYR